MNCWFEIERDLITRDAIMYFAGGTLIIDKDRRGKKIMIMLSVRGSCSIEYVHPTDRPHWFKNTKTYQPDYITKLVREIYLEVKGETEYFKENTKEKV